MVGSWRGWMNPTGPTESTNEGPTGTRIIGAGWGDYSEACTASASSLTGTSRLMPYEQRHGRSLSLVFVPGRRGCDCHEAHGSWNSHNYRWGCYRQRQRGTPHRGDGPSAVWHAHGRGWQLPVAGYCQWPVSIRRPERWISSVGRSA